LARHDDWNEYLAWVHDNTWLGWLIPEGTARKSLNQVLRRLLYPTPARLHRFHFGEGAHTTDRAISMLAALKQEEQAWFMFVNYMDVHAPYLPTSEQVDPFDEFDMRTSLRATVAAGGVDAEQAEELERLYLRELEDLDMQLGRLLSQVEKSLRPTLLVFTSDHGEMFGEHGQVEHGGSLFNNELAIPLIMVGPGVPVGVEHNYSAGLPDLSRTIAELAGIATSGMEGFDLLAQTSDAWSLSLMLGGCSLRHGDYKAHFVLDDRSSPPSAELVALYDLAVDPGETANLSSEKPDMVREFQGQIEGRLKDDIFSLLGERELSWNELRLLERMGYISDSEEE
jgi:arylsulfatase A-like enzyme